MQWRFAPVQTPAWPGGRGSVGRASHALLNLHILLTMEATAAVLMQNRGLALANVPARSAVRSIAPLTAALPTPARGFSSAGAPARDELERTEAVTSELQYVTRSAAVCRHSSRGDQSYIDRRSGCLQALWPVARRHFAVDDRCCRSRESCALL